MSLKSIFCMTFLVLCAASAVSAKEITVLYAINPPLICEKDGQIDCVGGNLVKAAAKAGGFEIKAQALPWARALEVLEQTPNAIFVAQPVPDGAPAPGTKLLAVWTDDVFIWTLDARKIASDADVATLQTVAIRRGTPFATFLQRKKSGAKVVDTNDWVQAAQMLDTGRVDAMALTGQIGQANIVDIQKVAPSRINKYKVGELSFWIMSGSKTGPEVAEFRKALETEKGKAEYQGMLKQMGVRP